jgi:hypothetical protein
MEHEHLQIPAISAIAGSVLGASYSVFEGPSIGAAVGATMGSLDEWLMQSGFQGTPSLAPMLLGAVIFNNLIPSHPQVSKMLGGAIGLMAAQGWINQWTEHFGATLKNGFYGLAASQIFSRKTSETFPQEELNHKLALVAIPAAIGFLEDFFPQWIDVQSTLKSFLILTAIEHTLAFQNLNTPPSVRTLAASVVPFLASKNKNLPQSEVIQTPKDLQQKLQNVFERILGPEKLQQVIQRQVTVIAAMSIFVFEIQKYITDIILKLTTPVNQFRPHTPESEALLKSFQMAFIGFLTSQFLLEIPEELIRLVILDSQARALSEPIRFASNEALGYDENALALANKPELVSNMHANMDAVLTGRKLLIDSLMGQINGLQSLVLLTKHNMLDFAILDEHLNAMIEGIMIWLADKQLAFQDEIQQI